MDKAIIINALPRSGSNILWNLIGSSPDVAMTGREFHSLAGFHHNFALKLALRGNVLCPSLPFMHDFIRQAVRASALDAQKLDTQKLAARGIVADQRGIVCFKVMGGDNRFNDLIAASYNQARFLCFLRDPAGLCDSYYRRDYSASLAGRMVAQSYDRMRAAERKYPDTVMVRFEDIARDVAGTVDRLYDAFGLQKPADGRYLLRTKAYGAGAEESSKQLHDKILLSPAEMQARFTLKTAEEYLAAVPQDYVRDFYHIAGKATRDIGYEVPSL